MVKRTTQKTIKIISCILTITLIACNKYPEGGLKHYWRINLLDKSWKLKKYSVNGVDSTDYLIIGNCSNPNRCGGIWLSTIHEHRVEYYQWFAGFIHGYNNDELNKDKPIGDRTFKFFLDSNLINRGYVKWYGGDSNLLIRNFGQYVNHWETRRLDFHKLILQGLDTKSGNIIRLEFEYRKKY